MGIPLLRMVRVPETVRIAWFLRVVATLGLSLAFLAPGARAVCHVPEITPSGEFFKSDVVFTGTVISVRYDDADVGGRYYLLHVERMFKGSLRKQVTVYTENSSARFPLDKGQGYLLFADRNQRRLEIYGCGNSAPLSKAAKSLEILEGVLHAGPYGEIGGWLVGETDGIDVSGVQVTVQGSSKTYHAVTDKDGWFHFRAPVGRYRVDFRSGEYYLNADGLFWYDANHFFLHAGEFATLQLVSAKHLPK